MRGGGPGGSDRRSRRFRPAHGRWRRGFWRSVPPGARRRPPSRTRGGASASASWTSPLLGSRVWATAAGGGQPGERAAHVGERLLHPRQRVISVDLVLEVDVAPEADRLELLEDLGDRDRSLADNALAPLRRQIAQVLGVHVEQAVADAGPCS